MENGSFIPPRFLSRNIKSLALNSMTDYDVLNATPFKRDIMDELAVECRKQGIRICWYHTIMDWHYPDYLPRRPWETRPDQGV